MQCRPMVLIAILLAGAALLSPGIHAKQPGPAARAARIFAADSFSGDLLPVYEITGGVRADFAQLNAGGWIGPLVVSPQGRLFAVTNAMNGSLWDITDGGDLTAAQPVAGNLFPSGVGFLEGLAFDVSGAAYISNGEQGQQPIAVVTPAGAVSYLPGMFDGARGLAVANGVLYIAESGTGRVVAYTIGTAQTATFATGFTSGGSHTAAEFAVDPRGRLLLLWAAGGEYGLFDITDGGSFAGRPPLVVAPFGIDVNQIAVDSANTVYAAGDGGGKAYAASLVNGSFTPFVVFAEGLGDTESVAVLP